jgi:sugar phosphate isomerase/epimerase
MLHRRQFLRAAALGGVAARAAVSRSLAAVSFRERGIPVGGHPWVYAAKLPGYDITPELGRIFADFAYAGLDGIELMHTALDPDGAVERIRKLSEQHRMPVIGSSFSAVMWDPARKSEALEAGRRVIERLEKVGGRTLGTSVGAAPKPKTAEQLDNQAAVLRELTRIGRDHGVVLNLHNHTYEVQNGLHDLKGTLERIPDAKLGPDLNWLVRGGVDPVEFIRKYGRQIVFLHLRDQNADGTWSEALGEGSMDFAAIAKALRDVEFEGTAVIELAHEGSFVPTRPIRDSFKQSRAFVRETMGF